MPCPQSQTPKPRSQHSHHSVFTPGLTADHVIPNHHLFWSELIWTVRRKQSKVLRGVCQAKKQASDRRGSTETWAVLTQNTHMQTNLWLLDCVLNIHKLDVQQRRGGNNFCSLVGMRGKQNKYLSSCLLGNAWQIMWSQKEVLKRSICSVMGSLMRSCNHYVCIIYGKLGEAPMDYYILHETLWTP